MTWRDNLIPASFRGVPFKINAASMTGGRRIVTHVFPERDDAEHEDRGRKNREFRVDAFVLGDDYFSQRDALIDALEETGPGVLKHPYRGQIDVVADSYTVNETVLSGRMATFAIIFKFDKKEKLTVILPGADVGLYSAQASFLSSLLTFLGEVYNIASFPVAVLQDVINGMNSVLAVALAAKKITGIYDEFQSQISTMQGQLSQAVLLATAIGNDIIDMVTFGTDVTDSVSGASASDPDTATEQFSEMQTMMGVQDSVLTDYPIYAENQDNYPLNELQKHTSRTALGAASGLVATMRIDNVEAADSIRSDLFKMADTVEEDPDVTDDLLASTLDLKVAIDRMIEDRKLTLDRVITIELPEFEPGVVLANRYLDDPTRDLEITAMNEILHPGFVPGSRDIRIQVD